MATIGDQMRLDLARAGYSAGTQRVYWADARALVKRFMKPPTEIGREELRMYVEELYASGISASRIKQHLASMTFLFAKTLGRPAEVSFISWPKQPRTLARVLAPEQISALLSALRSPKYRAIAMVMYGGGLRIGEACALEVNDIDAARSVIHVRHGKGDAPRDVLLSPTLLAALREYWRRERPPLPYLFVGKGTARPLAQGSVRKGHEARARRGGHQRRVYLAHATPQLRDPSARGGYRYPRHPTASRSQGPVDDRWVHPRRARDAREDDEPSRSVDDRTETLGDVARSHALRGGRFHRAPRVRGRGHRPRLRRGVSTSPHSDTRPGRGAARDRRVPHGGPRRPAERQLHFPMDDNYIAPS